MKYELTAPSLKQCPGCSKGLPLSAFGPNRSRPPLFLQSRCRACTNDAKSRKDAEKRKAAKAAKVSQDLAAIAAEVCAADVGRYAHVHLVGKSGFASQSLAVLAIPRTRGRWPVKPDVPDELTASHNWCDLVSDEARDQYREAGVRIQWMRARMGAGASGAPLEFD